MKKIKKTFNIGVLVLLIYACNGGSQTGKQFSFEKDELKLVEKKDSMGNVIEQYYLLNGYMEGKHLTYYSNGQIHELEEYSKGHFLGTTMVYDTIGKLIKEKRYVYLDNKWQLNEWVIFEDNEKIDSTKSFFIDFSINKNCFSFKGVTGDLSSKLDSSQIIVMYNEILDTISNTTNFNFYEYCLPIKFQGKVSIMFEPMANVYAKVPDELKDITDKSFDYFLESRFIYKEFIIQ